MYGMFPYIHHKNQPNAGIYTIWMVWDIVIFPRKNTDVFVFLFLIHPPPTDAFVRFHELAFILVVSSDVYPWSPKPWKMKVLNTQYMGEITPKNERSVGSHGKFWYLFTPIVLGKMSRHLDSYYFNHCGSHHPGRRKAMVSSEPSILTGRTALGRWYPLGNGYTGRTALGRWYPLGNGYISHLGKRKTSTQKCLGKEYVSSEEGSCFIKGCWKWMEHIWAVRIVMSIHVRWMTIFFTTSRANEQWGAGGSHQPVIWKWLVSPWN